MNFTDTTLFTTVFESSDETPESAYGLPLWNDRGTYVTILSTFSFEINSFRTAYQITDETAESEHGFLPRSEYVRSRPSWSATLLQYPYTMILIQV